ncbi:DUF6414 family protein [Limosilactobacillus fastidiosus]|uniref:Uncharacterized protein n=2 Tax=Limosilactobacillus fastidiosus TaxID=2759855 RepID=A0A7W3U0J8_9LACO|nr:hypothetical protein [Limosilactobacillus fastidiosus]MBB1086694.1 hypothetical protein [Limosilactobacillus fastidiosus]MCD7085579.1 hypothetical protein [Limosilactobacillus fastidiosus]MCD7114810.1 hypothetical protein [Limosilactobacillus fastidiosus]MCD7115941.1 hypothetical protein [Limosilactobacillus fastidiosus]
MDKKYKEIIFLNKTELYSALAQLNKGYVDSMINKSNNINGNVTSDTSSNASGISGGIPSVIKGEYKGTDTHTTSSEDSESFGKDLNVVLNDYNLNNLINVLKQKQLLNKLSDSDEGDFILTTSKFSLIDFKFSSEVLSAEHGNGINANLKNMMKATDGWNKELENNFKLMAHFMDFGNLMTQGNILLHMDGATILADSSNFRMNNGELQSIAYSSRPITVLGIVEAKTEGINVDSIISNTLGNDKDIQDLSKFGNIVPALSEMTFFSTGLLKSGDRFVKPIALYF